MLRTLTIAALVAAPLSAAPALAEDITVTLWSRADRSGPLRAGNIVAAAETLNGMFEAAGPTPASPSS